jgi:hypothetical protein
MRNEELGIPDRPPPGFRVHPPHPPPGYRAQGGLNLVPCTLHPEPCTLCTLHPAPCTLNPVP